MKQFEVSVSVDTYPSKPCKEDYEDMVFRRTSLNVQELKEHILEGHSFCHNFSRNVFMSFFTANKNFSDANFLVFDFDHSPVSFEYVLSNIKIKPSISFQTLSNSDTDFRFKLIYLFDNPITTIQDYKFKTDMLFNFAFNKKDYEIIKPAMDMSCYSAVQLFLGTNENKKIEITDTVISLDLLNQVVESKEKVFDSYEELFNHYQIASNDLKITNDCPKKENHIQLPIPPNDLNMNDTLGTPVNNLIYCKNPYNNFHAAIITDSTKSYFFVGDQHIYELSTYLRSNKVEDGKRHKTMKYHLIVIKNMYPSISLNEMFNRMRWLVDTYYSNPHQIDDNQIYRMCKSIIKIEKRTNTGRRKYILNPAFNYLSKADKIREFQKCKSEHTKNEILLSVDLNKDYKELSDELGYCSSTIRKHLKSEGFDLVKMKSDEKLKQFEVIYLSNKDKSIRELSSLTGVSKSQVSRYIKRLSQ